MARKKLPSKIKDEYPQVKLISFTMHFYDATRRAAPVTRAYTDKPNQGNYFAVPLECLYSECQKGGYDVKEALQYMIDHRLPSMYGERTCQGTLVRRRDSSTSPCHSHLEFELKAEYYDEGETNAEGAGEPSA